MAVWVGCLLLVLSPESRWYKGREVGRATVIALDSRGPLNLVGEQSLPL